MYKTVLATAGIVAITAIAFIVYRPAQSDSPVVTDSTATLKVAASIYSIEEFARQVGGDAITITVAQPVGVDAHDYEPTPQDVAAAYDSDVFLFHGAGVDAWAENLAPQLQAAGVQVLEITKAFTLDTTDIASQAAADPHIWLDPVLAQQEVRLIEVAFVAADPDHAATYRANADSYVAQLQQLDTDIRTTLTSCQQRTVITAHDAFHYFAKRYDLTPVGISGVDPSSEPSAKRVADIANQVTTTGANTIFFEELTSPKLAETLARETGVTTAVLYTIEGLTSEQATAGDTYISLMRSNLTALAAALDCTE